jgi:hypothetical protein
VGLLHVDKPSDYHNRRRAPVDGFEEARDSGEERAETLKSRNYTGLEVTFSCS